MIDTLQGRRTEIFARLLNVNPVILSSTDRDLIRNDPAIKEWISVTGSKQWHLSLFYNLQKVGDVKHLLRGTPWLLKVSWLMLSQVYLSLLTSYFRQ